MSQPGPVERVASLLLQSGYVRLQSPIAIAGVPFEFEAVFVGSDRAHDLVVVVDTVLNSDRRVRQRIDALGRALDVVGSLRPVSVVTVGPSPGHEVLETMSRVARVLVVGADGQEATIRDALAVLLPLEVPDATSESSEPFSAVAAWIEEDFDRASLAPLLSAAAKGERVVSAALAEYLAQPLAGFADEGDL